MSENSDELAGFDLGLPDFSEPELSPAKSQLDDLILLDADPVDVSPQHAIPSEATSVASVLVPAAEPTGDTLPKSHTGRGFFGVRCPAG